MKNDERWFCKYEAMSTHFSVFSVRCPHTLQPISMQWYRGMKVYPLTLTWTNTVFVYDENLHLRIIYFENSGRPLSKRREMN